MRYILLILSMITLFYLTSCSNTYNVNPAVEVYFPAVLCEVENDSLHYSFSLWTIGEEEVEAYQLDSYNNTWLLSKRFICYGPTNGFDVICVRTEGNSVYTSYSRILTPVAYNWGEEPEKTEPTRDDIHFSHGNKNEKGQIMYSLAPFSKRRNSPFSEEQREWVEEAVEELKRGK